MPLDGSNKHLWFIPNIKGKGPDAAPSSVTEGKEEPPSWKWPVLRILGRPAWQLTSDLSLWLSLAGCLDLGGWPEIMTWEHFCSCVPGAWGLWASSLQGISTFQIHTEAWVCLQSTPRISGLWSEAQLSLEDLVSFRCEILWVSRERELSGRFEPENRTHKQREETRKGEGKKEKKRARN